MVGPFVPQGSFTPVPLRGPAAIRHPWRGAALAASMPLGPRSETCVQPAPKSRLAVTEPFVYEDQKQINGFPGRTGFSREEAGVTTTNFTDYTRCFLVGPALAGKRPVGAPSIWMVETSFRLHALIIPWCFAPKSGRQSISVCLDRIELLSVRPSSVPIDGQPFQ